MSLNKEHQLASAAPPCCVGSVHCPLNRVRAGTSVRIKELSASPEMNNRLRELGFCEDKHIKLLSRQTNLICQVCNARLGISAELAEKILVEPIHLPAAC